MIDIGIGILGIRNILGVKQIFKTLAPAGKHRVTVVSQRFLHNPCSGGIIRPGKVVNARAFHAIGSEF